MTDHLNSVRDLVVYDDNDTPTLTDDTVTVAKHVVYDAFGNVTSDTAPTVESLFLYTARPFDPDTGLQNNLNRWYDEKLGRWLSEDPIGFAATDPNLYRYVRNVPTGRFDPIGLQEARLKIESFKYVHEPTRERMYPLGFIFSYEFTANDAIRGRVVFQDVRYKVSFRSSRTEGSPDPRFGGFYNLSANVRDLCQMTRSRTWQDYQNSSGLEDFLQTPLHNSSVCVIESEVTGDIRITDDVSVIPVETTDPVSYDPKKHGEGQVWATFRLTDAFNGRIIDEQKPYMINAAGFLKESALRSIRYVNNKTFYRLVWRSSVITELSRKGDSVSKYKMFGKIYWETTPAGGAEGVEGIPVFPDKGNLQVPGGMDRDYTDSPVEKDEWVHLIRTLR